MNPIETKKAIEQGNVINVSSSESYPLFVDKQIIDISSFGKGILKMTLPSVIKNINVDQSFKIKLKYPGGVTLNCIVTEIKTHKTIINCEIIGKVLTKRIFIEQTIITIDGKELFVLSSLYKDSTIIPIKKKKFLYMKIQQKFLKKRMNLIY